MKSSFNLVVLLFCLITYGHGRPSNNDEHDEIIREAKKEKYFQHDNVGEIPLDQTESSSTSENMLNRLKSIAHLRMADARKPAKDSMITREELETLRDLLDKNLQKYQNYDEQSVRRRPSEPYIGQILNNLNEERPYSSNGNNYPPPNNVMKDQQMRQQMPIRRKIIRHTVFATPTRDQLLNSNTNRVLGGGGGGDGATRIDWSSPWADYFPILIKDPFQTMMNSFSEIIEYGPAADICRHPAAADDGDEPTNRVDRRNKPGRSETLKRSRRHTAGTTTTAKAAAEEEEKGVLNHVPRPFRPHHHGAHQTTTEVPKVYHWATDKPAAEHNGDTGPQIKRLVVRRGGVAIAGPGGIATAGSGGTAIVGPGGSAYSSKDTASGATADAAPMMSGGISMAGYGPQMVQSPPPGNFYAAYPPHHLFNNNNINGYGRSVKDGGGSGGGGTAVLSSDGVAYTFPVASRGLTTVGGRALSGSAQRRSDGKTPQYGATREIVLPDGAKLIATGPIVYYNPEPASSSRAAVKKKTRKGRRVKSHDEPKRRSDSDDNGPPQSVF